jgi:predicted phage tail protein
MGLFKKSEKEQAIRASERERMVEERIRADERSTRNLITGLKITVLAGVLIAVTTFSVWLYLGAPKTGQQLAASLEQAGLVLPTFGVKKP